MTNRSLMSDRELNLLHKEELTKAWQTSEAELHKIQELQRLEWSQRVATRGHVRTPTLEDVLTKSTSSPSGPVVTQEPLERTCRDCSTPLPIQTTRGRPPVRCESCKHKLQKETQATKKTHNICTVEGCGRKFPLTGKRGRQPSKCPKCVRKLERMSNV